MDYCVEKTLAAIVLGSTHWCAPSWRPSFSHNTQPQPIANRFLCWDTSGQMTNRAVTQPHPSADRLHKILPSLQLPVKHTLWHSSVHQRYTVQLYPPVGKKPSLPPGSLHKPVRSASSTSEQIAEAIITVTLQLVEWKQQSHKGRQNEMAGEYVSDKGTR